MNEEENLGENMSNFLKMLNDNNIDTERMDTKGNRKLNVNFKELVSEAMKDILTEKSSLYRHLLEKGVAISFEVKLPKDPLTGHISELITKFKEDVQ